MESSYQNAVADSDVVVHSIGLLLENSRYKLALGDNKSATLTYDKINHQSAVQLAQSLVGSPRFVYISADAGFWPVIPAGYINSKRAAEYDLTGMAKLRTLILRPGFMYDETDRGGVRYGVLSVVEGLRSIPGVGYLLRPTISTQQVASGLYKSLERYPSDKIVSLEELKNI